MPLVVGIRFKPVTKIYYFDPTPFEPFEVDDRVIVETSRGIELGTVAMATREVPKSEIKSKLKRVIRPAAPLDLMQAEQFKAQEPLALDKCNQLVMDMNIPIKVLQAEYSFDGSRLLFAFISEQRVDFRDLVKELARSLRTRIEMKQVGARDTTKLMDGIGPCGRQLCCSSHLRKFEPISVKMAKGQDMPLTDSRLLGNCGRLKCCLLYEFSTYDELRHRLPKVGTACQADCGGQGCMTGKVKSLRVLKQAVVVGFQDGTEAEVPIEQVTWENRPHVKPL
jgi:cell fate regulator YaaT (PSP1 superfamily)